VTDQKLLGFLERARFQGFEEPRLEISLRPHAVEFRFVANRDGRRITMQRHLSRHAIELALVPLTDFLLDEMLAELRQVRRTA
jgi:hypothetical protein